MSKIVLFLFLALVGGAVGVESRTALYVSKFQDTLVDLPAPTAPLVHGDSFCGIQANGTPSLPRTDRISYAMVDGENKLGPWSDPVTMTFPAGGGVYFTHTDFVPGSPECSGVCWRINNDVALVYDQGVGPREASALFPWSAVRPDLITYLAEGGKGYALPTVHTSKVFTAKPPAPVFWTWNIPNVDLEVAYCWLVGNVESELSPSCKSPRRPNLTDKGVGFRRFHAPEMKIPPGATGYRVYLRFGAGAVKWCRAGDFPVDCQQPTIFNFQPTGFSTTGPARATVSALQMALDARQYGDVVVVDVPEVKTGYPILDRFGPEQSKIVGLHGGRWKLNYTGGGEVALLVQSSYTTYEGLELIGGCRATSNWASGQAFGCQYRDCIFRQGIRTLKTSSSTPGNHTESETGFDNCFFSGKVPIRLEGDQTASVRFRRSHVHGDQGRAPGTCALWIDTTNPVVFTDGLFVDWGHVLAYLGSGTNVRIDDVFCDQGYGCFFQGYGAGKASVKLRGGKLNAWAVDGKQPYLVRGPFGTDAKLEDVMVQQSLPGELRKVIGAKIPGF